MKAETIFLQLLEARNDPEPLGATLRLDLKPLYELGAVKAMQQGNHVRALELYMLAQSPHQQVRSGIRRASCPQAAPARLCACR